MGLFDFFKNKSDQQTKDNLSLEILLQKSATDPAVRPEFYKRLLSDKLVVITNFSGQQDGLRMTQTGEKVNIFNYPDGKIPVFTSKPRIFDKGVVKEELKVLEMKGENLFTLATGATFILNPYSDYGKELLPSEIAQMLNGTILTTAAHNQIKIQKDTPIQIGQPANYPTEIVNALRQLFSSKPNIKAAYLGWILNPASNEPPHYIFALDGDGDLQSITHEADSSKIFTT